MESGIACPRPCSAPCSSKRPDPRDGQSVAVPLRLQRTAIGAASTGHRESQDDQDRAERVQQREPPEGAPIEHLVSAAPCMVVCFENWRAGHQFRIVTGWQSGKGLGLRSAASSVLLAATDQAAPHLVGGDGLPVRCRLAPGPCGVAQASVRGKRSSWRLRYLRDGNQCSGIESPHPGGLSSRA